MLFLLTGARKRMGIIFGDARRLVVVLILNNSLPYVLKTCALAVGQIINFTNYSTVQKAFLFSIRSWQTKKRVMQFFLGIPHPLTKFKMTLSRRVIRNAETVFTEQHAIN